MREPITLIAWVNILLSISDIGGRKKISKMKDDGVIDNDNDIIMMIMMMIMIMILIRPGGGA